ncbi:MAG: hypothetical protein WC748_09525 [Legionellales bacterium]|jgi:hypothetical protein
MKATDQSKKISTQLQVEDESFWRQHYQAHQSSGLTRREYCRKNSIDYYRFGYWLKKCSKQNAQLIEVKIKPSENNLSPSPPSELCTLRLRGGHEIKINNVQALSLILEKIT